jgi:hypothetical protein
MLQGFEKNKLSSLLQDDDKRLPIEDLITAAVFGTAAYTEPELSMRMLRVIVGGEFPFPEKPTAVEVELWPRTSGLQTRSWIEPDVTIDITDGEPALLLRLIVEAKWNSPLSPKQAIEQWQYCASKAGNTWHFFVVRSKASVEAQLQTEAEIALEILGLKEYEVWQAHRRVISWFEISGRLTHAVGERSKTTLDHRLVRWAKGVLSVLKLFGEKPFEGFKHIKPCSVIQSERPTVFWCGSNPGHITFNWPAPIIINLDTPIFYRTISSAKGNSP